jgi:hypothetical protein
MSALAALAPGLAEACPACARNLNGSTYALVAAMITLPYIVSMVVIRVIRQVESDEPTAVGPSKS